MINQLFELPHLVGSIFSPWVIGLILIIVLLFFGGSKLPELMKGVGKGVGEFKKGVEEGKDDDDKAKPA